MLVLHFHTLGFIGYGFRNMFVLYEMRALCGHAVECGGFGLTSTLLCGCSGFGTSGMPSRSAGHAASVVFGDRWGLYKPGFGRVRLSKSAVKIRAFVAGERGQGGAVPMGEIF
jgi:hypothetical protein